MRTVHPFPEVDTAISGNASPLVHPCPCQDPITTSTHKRPPSLAVLTIPPVFSFLLRHPSRPAFRTITPRNEAFSLFRYLHPCHTLRRSIVHSCRAGATSPLQPSTSRGLQLSILMRFGARLLASCRGSHAQGCDGVAIEGRSLAS